MKNILLLALLAGATVVEAAPFMPTQAGPGQTPASAKEMKRKRKLAKKTGPEVYKGTVAEQSRVITDAPGSEKDDAGDGTDTGKNGKAGRSKKQ